MRRRDLLALLGLATAWPLDALAQQSPVLVGFLSSGSSKAYEDFLASFRRGLEVFGYTEGRNTVIESRWADGRSAELPALAEDLVRRNVHLIAATGIGSALAAKAATSRIPLVFVSGDDPVRFGLVASFSRPGGNATGVNLQTSTLVGKRLDLVYDLAPTGRVAFLTNPTNPEAATQLADVQAAALASMRQMMIMIAQNESELEHAFAALVEHGISTLMISNDPLFNSRRDQLVALALRHKVLTVYDRREYVAAGGLISYGVDYRAAYREMGIYAGKILRGTAPADLPILQPTKFELVINAKAAAALGVIIPPALFAQADEVIE
jgi:putative tryptophan/tyrosine transport system substrate-binding protein